jgi:hypothetical protein
VYTVGVFKVYSTVLHREQGQVLKTMLFTVVGDGEAGMEELGEK